MKSSQAPYQACVLLEEASAETAAAKRLWFVPFIFNFPIEMPEGKKKKKLLPWRALQLWERYLLQCRDRLVLGTAWPSTAQGAVVCSFFLYLFINFDPEHSQLFQRLLLWVGFFWVGFFFWWRAERALAHRSRAQQEAGERERRQPGLRQLAGHKDACHVLPLRQRSLSFRAW